jgi:hypothetical protein
MKSQNTGASGEDVSPGAQPQLRKPIAPIVPHFIVNDDSSIEVTTIVDEFSSRLAKNNFSSTSIDVAM